MRGFLTHSTPTQRGRRLNEGRDMALPVCALCGENEAAQMITNFETGESLAICQDDFPTFILGLAEQMMEAGMIDLPEVEVPAPAGPVYAEATGDTQVIEDAPTAQAPVADPKASTGTITPAKRKKPLVTTTAAPGPSPAESLEVPTDTVAPETATTADSSVDALAN